MYTSNQVTRGPMKDGEFFLNPYPKGRTYWILEGKLSPCFIVVHFLWGSLVVPDNSIAKPVIWNINNPYQD